MQIDRQPGSPNRLEAPLKSRIYAFMLDYLIIVIYGIFVVGTIFFMFRPFVTPLFSNSPVIAELSGFIMITLPVSLYFILFECSGWKGTWGKKKMGILVVNNNNQRIGPVRSTIRTAIKFLPWEIAHFCIWRFMLPSGLSEPTVITILVAVNFAIVLYLLVPLTNKPRKNVYDWIAGTKVVQ
ncbi:RDD family protein [Virgibacillus phasianinus]|uniref:RDD family protein n=1 Tax=Virgibacillus phasianinus TaxID=2017483 RepID=A0A220U7A7_9BACI|nr:RDD family protein [Virgibacillus phasianinus]ASK63776.1 RDD family protein [Virgibacillus phasianinus]